MHALKRHLQQLAQGACLEDEPLARHTTWRMGGPADFLVQPQSEEQLAAVTAFCLQEGLPMLLMAGGSNLLCDDAGLRGVAVKLVPDSMGEQSPLSVLRVYGERIEAGAGCRLADLARFAARAGLSGLEHASNIPGSLGGCIVMNGGSNRRSISENLERVQAVTPLGERLELRPEGCGFAYRTSDFQHNGLVVTSAVLRLTREAPETVMSRIEADLAERSRKFPLHLPSCGSVFKSHESLYALHGPPGKVIEDTGLKGLRVGDVQVSPQHANFFVNLNEEPGAARASDALALMARVREAVHARTGERMECEVRYVAPDGRVMAAHQALEGRG